MIVSIIIGFLFNIVISLAGNLYAIDGKASVDKESPMSWTADCRVHVDGDFRIGYLRSDGSFSIPGLPTGSYVIEIISPLYSFDSVRVDISSKGKLRARKVDHLQPNTVVALPYPLKFKALGLTKYFQIRETWRLTDVLLNPMVLMMVLPCVLILLVPRIINSSDPDTQREVQQSMNMLNPNKNDMPEISELMTNWFGGGSSSSKKAITSSKQRVKKSSAR